MNTWQAQVRNGWKRSALYFCIDISNRLLHKTVSMFSMFFSNNELFIFCFNNSSSFEIVFCMKTVESRLFKKYLKRRKLRAWFCISLAWLHISEKNYRKLLFCCGRSSWSRKSLTQSCLIFPIFGQREMGKLHISKKVLVLVHLKRYFKSMQIIALSSFLLGLYFAWKSTLKP